MEEKKWWNPANYWHLAAGIVGFLSAGAFVSINTPMVEKYSSNGVAIALGIILALACAACLYKASTLSNKGGGN